MPNLFVKYIVKRYVIQTQMNFFKNNMKINLKLTEFMIQLNKHI